MAFNAENLAQEDPKKVSSVALVVFFNISKGWKLTPKQELSLLGSPPRSTFYKWKKGQVKVLSHDTLERISYVMGVYKALRKIFPTAEQANTWPIKPNKAFESYSALDYMLQGSVQHLSDVRRYLDEITK